MNVVLVATNLVFIRSIKHLAVMTAATTQRSDETAKIFAHRSELTLESLYIEGFVRGHFLEPINLNSFGSNRSLIRCFVYRRRFERKNGEKTTVQRVNHNL